MKKFYSNVALFTILMLVVLVIFDYLSMVGISRTIIAKWTDSGRYIIGNSGPDEIKRYIAKVQTQDGTTKLILGDSVCHQMFNALQEYNDDFSISGSNAAITMAGQYILAKEYIDNHPDATDIFLIVLPKSLGSTFGSSTVYRYTVMPFVETDTLKYLDEDTIRIMESVYGKFFIKPSVVTSISLSGVNQKLYSNYVKTYRSEYTLENHFELADKYVCKIYEMCQERGINFHFYPCPVSDENIEYVDGLKNDFEESLIYNINPDYLESVCYYPAKEFVDKTHFGGNSATREGLNEIIKHAFENEIIIEMINFD